VTRRLRHGEGIEMRVRWSIFALIAPIVSSTWGIPPRPVLITFEAFPGPDGVLGTSDDIPVRSAESFPLENVQLTDQFASLGILFDPNPPVNDLNEILLDSGFGLNPGSPPHILASSTAAGGVIEGTFIGPVFDLGMVLGIGAGRDRLSVFDIDGSLAETVALQRQLVQLHFDFPVLSFIVTPLDGGASAAIDDLSFAFSCGPPGDADCDGDVDAADLAIQLACMQGPDEPSRAGCDDLNHDGAFDIADFAIIENCVSGNGVPGDYHCRPPLP